MAQLFHRLAINLKVGVHSMKQYRQICTVLDLGHCQEDDPRPSPVSSKLDAGLP
jgi:hypothetical protein